MAVTPRKAPDGRPTLAVASSDPGTQLDRIARSPIFAQLVQERTRFGWILTGLMLLVYVGFIGLIAFDKQLLAVKVGGGTASLGRSSFRLRSSPRRPSGAT